MVPVSNFVTIIYQVEDLFIEKDLAKKTQMVRAHYERAYDCKLKTDLPPDQIDFLYRKLKQLAEAELFHREPK